MLQIPSLNSPLLVPAQGENESSPKLEEAGRVGTLEPGILKKLVNHLVPAHRHSDPIFVPAFLTSCRRFATTRQVLYLLFLRCAPPPRQGTHRLPMALGNTLHHSQSRLALWKLGCSENPPLRGCSQDQVGCGPRAPTPGLALYRVSGPGLWGCPCPMKELSRWGRTFLGSYLDESRGGTLRGRPCTPAY